MWGIPLWEHQKDGYLGYSCRCKVLQKHLLFVFSIFLGLFISFRRVSYERGAEREWGRTCINGYGSESNPGLCGFMPCLAGAALPGEQYAAPTIHDLWSSMNTVAMMDIDMLMSLSFSYGEIKTITSSKWSSSDFDPRLDPVASHCFSLSEGRRRRYVQLGPQTEGRLRCPHWLLQSTGHLFI